MTVGFTLCQAHHPGHDWMGPWDFPGMSRMGFVTGMNGMRMSSNPSGVRQGELGNPNFTLRVYRLLGTNSIQMGVSLWIRDMTFIQWDFD